MLAAVEAIPVYAYVTYQDEAGHCYWQNSDWLFIEVEHRPVFIRLSALEYKPVPQTPTGQKDVAFFGTCVELLYGGNPSPYAPQSTGKYPSGARFVDGSGGWCDVWWPWFSTASVGKRWLVRGRVLEGHPPALAAYSMSLAEIGKTQTVPRSLGKRFGGSPDVR